MRVFKLIEVLAFFMLLTFACTQRNYKPSVSSNKIEVIDAAGRKLSISSSSKFILTISQTEIFRVLGAENRVEGVNRWVAQLNPEENPILSKLPVIGGFSPGDVNYEMIYKIAHKSLEDDVVLIYNKAWADNVDEKINNFGNIKVLKLNLFGSSEPQKEIAILAKVLGKDVEGKRYISWFDSLFLLVNKRVQNIPIEKRVKVYWDASGKGHYDTAGKNTSADYIISNAGGILLSKQYPNSSMTISPEWILQQNPDIILSHAANARHSTSIQFGYGATNADTLALFKAWQDLLNTPGISHTNAALNKRAYFISDDLMSGPSQAVGVVILAKWFYPDKFADIDVKQLHSYYYKNFMKLDYKGFYIYPIRKVL